ncbi:MAG: hypothetical protein ABSF71_38855, partial [Terriglobia bacterium]
VPGDVDDNKCTCAPGERGEASTPIESKPELPNAHGHEFTAANAPEGSTPEAGVTPPCPISGRR